METLSLVIGPWSLVLSAPSDLSVVKEIVEMSEKAGDQSALLYATGAAVIVLTKVVILLWAKWNSSRKDNKQAAVDRETLIKDHIREMNALRDAHGLEIRELNRENNRISEKLSEIMVQLKATRL